MKKCGCGGKMRVGGSTNSPKKANLDVVAMEKLRQMRSFANPPKGNNTGTTTTGVVSNYKGHTGKKRKINRV
jgi:hypothetical protein